MLQIKLVLTRRLLYYSITTGKEWNTIELHPVDCVLDVNMIGQKETFRHANLHKILGRKLCNNNCFINTMMFSPVERFIAIALIYLRN